MAFPNGARLRTYAAGDQLQSADINAMQDADIAAYDEVFNRRLHLIDSFTGQSINAGNWATTTGTVTVVDDSANGGNGTAKVDGSGGGTNLLPTRPLAFGGDFRLRGRLRATGVAANTSIIFGLSGGAADVVSFVIDGPTSTANWRALINGTVTAPNGTAAAVNAAYLEFEIKRVGTLVTMSIGGVIFHTVTVANLAGNFIRASANISGILWLDWVGLLM